MEFKKTVPILLFCLLTSFVSYGESDIFVFVVKKQEAKKASRWSLEDWFLTKKKMAAQDRWLALNSSATIFEAFIAAGYSDHTITNNGVETKGNIKSGEGSLFITILGFGGDYYYSSEGHHRSSWYGALRVFGKSIQDTGLTLIYGKTMGDGNRKYANNFYGGKLTIYLTKLLGAELDYREYLGSDYDGVTITGDYRAVTFSLDPYFISPYATIWSETISGVKREGTKVGLKFFF